MENKKYYGWKGFFPLLTFLAIYLGSGLICAALGYGGDSFKQVPRMAALVGALLVCMCMGGKERSLEYRMDTFCKGMSNQGTMIMIMVFLLAGAFSGVAKAMGGVQATANLGLSLVPTQFMFAGLFLISAFMATAMGTSMGTISAVGPIAVAVAESAGLNLALAISTVLGGAMFGDNLSFISDTTIAACNGQGCEMKDKFRENFWIALPAALAALALILVISFRQAPGTPIVHEYHLLQMVPYLLVLIGGIAGIQVFVVLLIGIASGAVIMLGTGQTTLWDMLSSMGSGTSGMFETCMVAILVAAMCALIRENGGFTVLLRAIHKIFRGKKGGQLGVGILVALLDIATANNTVAIVMANPIAKQMSEDYGITPRKTASLLDTFSCISQGILPYGAQMLVAISAVHELGYELSAFEIMANLFYPGMLLVSSLIFIFVLPDRKNAENNA